ncbi:MAG: hypothetical protein R3A44_27675 [Caldilineaceae bacterium]
MTQRTFSAPPYIERRLDIWKSCLLFVLFAILLLSALFWRQLQPRTQIVILDEPRMLPPIRLETIPTVAPTATSVASVGTPLAQLGAGEAAATADAATNATMAALSVAETAAQSVAAATQAATTATAIAAAAPTSAALTSAAPTSAAPTPTTITQSTIPFAAPSAPDSVASAPPPIETPAEVDRELTLEASLIPLTLSYPPPNAALPALVVSHLEGTGAPGTLITVNYIHCATCTGALFRPAADSQKNPQILVQTLGSALADGRRRPAVPLSAATPGQYHLLLTQTRPDGVELPPPALPSTCWQRRLARWRFPSP